MKLTHHITASHQDTEANSIWGRVGRELTSALCYWDAAVVNGGYVYGQ